MSSHSDPVDPVTDGLIARWTEEVAQQGLRVEWHATGNAGAPWSVDAVARDGERVGNGMGRSRAEALEVLVWNLFGRDPVADEGA